MTDASDFLPWAEAQAKAEQIIPVLDDTAREALLHQAAYRKRIKRVPDTVIQSAVEAFKAGAAAALVEFDNPAAAVLVMDKVSDALWDAMDEKTRYEWLLKAV